MAIAFLCSIVCAEDDGTVQGPDKDALADAVIEAVRNRDKAEVTRIAKLKQVCWSTVEKICRRREFAAAMALAQAAATERPVRDKALPAYVKRARTAKHEPGAGQAVNAAASSYKKDPLGTLRYLKKFKADRGDVSSGHILFIRGLAYSRVGKKTQSAASLLAAAGVYESIGWLYRANAAYNFAGVTAIEDDDIKTAKTCFTKQLPLAKACRDGMSIALAYMNMSVVFRHYGHFGDAGRYLEEALKVTRKHGLLRNESQVLMNIGRNSLNTGQFRRGVECARAAIAIFKENGWDRELPYATLTLGDILLRKGDLTKALQAIRTARTLNQRRGDELQVAIARHSEAMLEATRGNFKGAVKQWKAALPVFRRFGRHGDVARAVHGLAAAKSNFGKYEEAIADLQTAFKRQSQLGDRPNAANALASIGAIQALRGDSSDAFATWDRAFEMSRDMRDTVGMIHVLLNMANLHGMLGEDAKALDRHKAVLRIRREIGDAAGIADALRNVAHRRTGLNKNERARAALEEGVRICEKSKNRGGLANTLTNLGIVEKNLGNTEKAIEHVLRAIRILKEIGNRSGLVFAHKVISSAYVARGEFKRAVSHIERSVSGAEALGERLALARGLGAHAYICLRTKQFAKASQLARRGLAEVPFIVGQLGEQQGAAARTQFADLYHWAAWAGAEAGDAAALCHGLESGRAGILLESLGMNKSLRTTTIPFELREANRKALLKESEALARYRAAVEGKQLKTIRAAKKELEEVRATVSETLERIRRDAKRASDAFYPKLATLPEIQSSLRDGETLVMYGVFYETFVLVVSNSDARIIRLGRSGPIKDAAAQALPEAFGSGTRGFRRKKASVTADTGQAIAKLRKRLVDPLGLDAKTKRLLISPHGVLSYVPFALLHPDREVVYVPSGTVYRALARDRDKRGTKVLAVGDPEYPKGLARLPATEAEARAVGDVVLIRDKATKAGFLDAVSGNARWRSVHFACHGLLNPEHPLFAALALTPTDRSDGRLTVAELFTAEIPADLVVLSACDTGRGAIVRGEGIIGLTRAFVYAGSPRVLASLWKVDDEATRALMKKFYELWNPKDGSKGLPTATALKNAQRYVREHPKHREWKHPFYWAAWQLWGLPD